MEEIGSTANDPDVSDGEKDCCTYKGNYKCTGIVMDINNQDDTMCVENEDSCCDIHGKFGRDDCEGDDHCCYKGKRLGLKIT